MPCFIYASSIEFRVGVREGRLTGKHASFLAGAREHAATRTHTTRECRSENR